MGGDQPGANAPVGRRSPAPRIRLGANRHASVALLLFITSALVVYCWLAWSPSHFGDGFEYLNMSVAFARHGTPDLRVEDLRAILREYPHDGFLQDQGTKTLNHFMRGQGDFGFSPSPVDGRFYSYHFWLYSLLNTPATVLCMWLGIPLRNSFLLTNCALFLGLVSVIAFGTAHWRFRRKCLLALLALVCGATFYLNRESPESMCFSLLAIGLVLLETRRYAWALLAFAAAAQQNPPIGLLALSAGVAACWKMILDWRTSRSKQAVLQASLHLLPGAMVLIASPVFYFVMFGTPNLIVKAGGSSTALISGPD